MTSLATLEIAPGQRSDVMIKAPNIKPGATESFYYLKRLAPSPATGNPSQSLFGTAGNTLLVATLKVRGEPKPMDLPRNSEALARCRPFKPVADTELVTPTLVSSDRKTNADTLIFHGNDPDNKDQGMMMPIEFLDPGAPKPVAKAAVLKPMNRPAANVVLADPSGAAYQLSESRGKKIALVFFKGIQCSHCAEDLRLLLKDARASLGKDTEIIAISARKISDPALAARLLGVVAGDRFHLLVDGSNTSFKASDLLISTIRL